MKVVQKEIGFRKLDLNANNVLADTLDACYTLFERNSKSQQFNQLQQGFRNFTNFTIDRFSTDEAITAGAKVAYLSKLIQLGKWATLERFKNPLEIKDWLIKNQEYNKQNKLKKSSQKLFTIGLNMLATEIKNKIQVLWDRHALG